MIFRHTWNTHSLGTGTVNMQVLYTVIYLFPSMLLGMYITGEMFKVHEDEAVNSLLID